MTRLLRPSRPALALFAVLAGFAVPRVSRSGPEDPLARDPRLAGRVRVHAEGISIADLLSRIGEVTRVPLRADRATADEKVVVLGPARPLRDILGDIAALLGDRWEAAEDGALVLRPDPRARRREASLAESTSRAVAAQLAVRFRALAEPVQQLQRRPATDPIRNYLLHPPSRLGTALLAALAPVQVQRLIERGQLWVAIAELTPPQRMLWHEWCERALPAAAQSRYVELTLRYDAMASGSEGVPGRLDLDLMRRLGGGTVAVLQWRMERPPLRGNPYGGVEAPAVAAAAERIPGPAEGECEGGAWVESLRGLAESAGVPVVADYYRLRRLGDYPPARNRELPPDRDCGPGAAAPDPAAAMDALAQGADAVWWSRGRTLLLRRSDWYLRRQFEVPDRWLDETARRLRTRGYAPTFSDLLRLEELSWREQRALAAVREGLTFYPRDPDEPGVPQGLLELLALIRGRRLDPELGARVIAPEETVRRDPQVRAAMTLTYERMRPDQRARLLPFLATQPAWHEGAPVQETSITFRSGSRKPAGHPEEHSVVVHVEWRAGAGPGGWLEVRLPTSLPDDRRARTRLEAEPAPPAERGARSSGPELLVLQ